MHYNLFTFKLVKLPLLPNESKSKNTLFIKSLKKVSNTVP